MDQSQAMSECGSWSATIAEKLLLLYCFAVPFVPPVPISRAPYLEVSLLDVLFVPSLAFLGLRLGRLRLGWPGRALLAYLAVVFLSILNVGEGEARFQCFLRAVRFAEMCVPFFVAMALPYRADRLRRLARAFMWGGGASMVLGLAVFLLQVDPGESLQAFHVGPERFFRAGGIFFDTSAFGYLVAVWLTLSVAYLLRFRGIRFFLGAVFVGFLGGYALCASLSRSALVNLCVVGVCGAYFGWRAPWRRKAATVLGLATAIGLTVVSAWMGIVPGLLREAAMQYPQRAVSILSLVPEGEGKRAPASEPVPTLTRVDVASSGRIGLWRSHLRHFRENPLTGIGYKALILERGLPPDNNYLAALVETGVLGFSVLAFYALSLLCGLGRRLGRDLLAITLFLVLLGSLAHALTLDVLTFWGTTPALGALFGSALGGPARHGRAEGGGPR